jgi:ligand-binding sensor domain-containing protein
MNKIYNLLLLVLIASCNGQGKTHLPDNCAADSKTTTAGQSQRPDCCMPDSMARKYIRAIVQDKNGNIWIGTNGDGVYRYDGKSAAHFTKKEGLFDNRVSNIIEDNTGQIWFDSPHGICRYDGKTFTGFTDEQGPRNYDYGSTLEYKSGSVWFGNYNGVWRHDGQALTNFTIHPASYKDKPNSTDKPYSVYSILEDKDGNLWFGTEKMGVCRYDGKSFTWFTEKGLDYGAVRGIFQDKAGNIWFGTNGGGVCLYNGKSFINFSEEKGLSKNLAKAELEDETQKLNRVWSVAEDNTGNIWFGTIDEGVWRYDGKSMVNFTVKDGLASNEIWTVCNGKSGNIWFGTNGEGVSRYDGKSFTSFQLKPTVQ